MWVCVAVQMYIPMESVYALIIKRLVNNKKMGFITTLWDGEWLVGVVNFSV